MDDTVYAPRTPPRNETAAAVAVRTPRIPPSRASFDCRRPLGDIPHAICRDPELAGLDRELSTRFAALDASVDAGTIQAIHHGETTFLNDRQNCSDRDCLVEVYRNRLRELDEVAH